MAVKWTKEQEQVIGLRNRNILVSAAAGSGKTAVLGSANPWKGNGPGASGGH